MTTTLGTASALALALLAYKLTASLRRGEWPLSSLLNLAFFLFWAAYRCAHAFGYSDLMFVHHNLDRDGYPFFFFVGYMVLGWAVHLIWSILNLAHKKDKCINVSVALLASLCEAATYAHFSLS